MGSGDTKHLSINLAIKLQLEVKAKLRMNDHSYDRASPKNYSKNIVNAHLLL